MELRNLGTTDLKISPIGLGCWQFSQGRGIVGGVWPSLPSETTDGIVQAALAGGINWFDTAEVYGKGASERALAAALGRKQVAPGSVVVATKWWPLGRMAGSIGKTFPQREAALAPYPIDLLQVHQPVSLSPIEKQARALANLLRGQKVRAVGISNYRAEGLRTFHHVLKEEGFTLASNQVRYHLIDRSIETDGTLDAARDLGVTIIAYSPLAQGLLSGKFHDDPSLLKNVSTFRRLRSGLDTAGLAQTEPLVHTLQRIARDRQVTASQVALAWLVHFWGDAVVAIPGATQPRHAVEAAAAMQLDLSRDDLTWIDRASRP